MLFDWIFNDLFGKSDFDFSNILPLGSWKGLLGVDSKSIISSYHITGDTVDIEYKVTDENIDEPKKCEEILDVWEDLSSVYKNIKITIKFNDKDVFEYNWDDNQKCFNEKVYQIPERKDIPENEKKNDKDEAVEKVIEKGIKELNENIEKKTLAQELDDKFNFAANLEKKIKDEEKHDPIFIPESASDIFEDYIVGGEHFKKVSSADKKTIIGIKFSILDLIVNNDDRNENRKNLKTVIDKEDNSLIRFCEILMNKYGFKQVVWDMCTIERNFIGHDYHKYLDAIDIANGDTDSIDDIEFTAYF